jgi:hypothetical protein
MIILSGTLMIDMQILLSVREHKYTEFVRI